MVGNGICHNHIQTKYFVMKMTQWAQMEMNRPCMFLNGWLSRKDAFKVTHQVSVVR